MLSLPRQSLLTQTRPALAIKIPACLPFNRFVPGIVFAGSRNRSRKRSAKPEKAIQQCISTAASTLRLLSGQPLGLLFNYSGSNGGKGGGSDFWRGFGSGGPDRNWRRNILGFDVVLASVTILLVFGRRPEDRDLGVRVWTWGSSLLGCGLRAWGRHRILGLFCFCVLMAVALGLEIEGLEKFIAPYRVSRRKRKRGFW